MLLFDAIEVFDCNIVVVVAATVDDDDDDIADELALVGVNDDE